jgi:N-acetylglucosamine-6-sulfatase
VSGRRARRRGLALPRGSPAVGRLRPPPSRVGRFARLVWLSALTPMLVGLIGLSVVNSPESPRTRATTVRVTKDHSTRPDIVLILTDDQRWDTLWAMPNVQSLLVDHGVTFANAFVVNSLCCPSRSSILTGDYSHTTGVYSNGGAHGGFGAFHDGSTIATWLHAAGYDTGLVGKYLNGTPGGYVPPGWDRWNAIVMQPPQGNYYYDFRLTSGKRVREYGGDAGDYSTTVLANHAVQFIRSARGPMFLYFAPWAPHGAPIPPPGDELAFSNLPPFRPPGFNEPDVSDKPAYIREQDPFNPYQVNQIDEYRRAQYQSLLGVDQAVGRIVSALRATGRLDHTMIVFMSDNGLAWGEHRWHNKQTPYEESIRVPMVISYPPLTSNPRTVSQMALNIDLAPTFARLAGVEPPAHDGQSLLGLLRGDASGWRTSFLVEHATGRGREWIPAYCALRTTDALYVVNQTGEREYYDLDTDPGELSNLAGDPAAAGGMAGLDAQLHRLCDPPPPGMFRP